MVDERSGEYGMASVMIDRDKPINVHEGTTLMPFTLIKLGENPPLKLRYTIGALLELEQTFSRSLWTIIEQALIGSLGEEEKTIILCLGISNATIPQVNSILNNIARSEATRAFDQSQLELTRAIGHEIVYDDNGTPIKMKPRAIETYKKADVRDAENFELKKPQLATFGQWYELALNTLFQIGATIPIEEIMSMMPIELEAFFSSHDKRLIYTQKMAVFEAWHTGLFTAKAMSGDALPDLEPILRRIDRQSDKATQSKFTNDEARQIIEQDRKDAEAFERARQAKQGRQAKQSDDGEIK